MDRGPSVRREERRTRVLLAAAVLLVLPAAAEAAAGGGTGPWQLLLALAGLALAFAGVRGVLRAHRDDVDGMGWLDALASTLSTTGLLMTVLDGPVQRATGAGHLQVHLQLAVVGALLVVTATAVVVLGQVGRQDRRTVLLAGALVSLLAASAAHLGRSAGLVDAPAALTAALTAAAGAGAAAALAVPGSRSPVRGPGPLGEGVATFATMGGAAVVLFAATPAWAAPPTAVVLAGAALLCAGIRLALLLRDLPALVAVRQTAVVDEVTGLGNRRSLLAGAAALVQRSRTGASLVVLDVDSLHVVTNTWGREVGDALLQQVAARLDAALATCPGLVAGTARVDGGVFAVLLRTGGVGAAEARARDVLAALEAPFALPQRSVRLRVAVGIALLHPTAAPQAAAAAVDALRRGEAAATASRATGGAPVVHDAALDEAVTARAALAAALTAAIEAGQLVLHYQPQLALGGAVVQGAEALVRWHDPEHGLVPPDVFVPLAGELGLQGPLTRWVVGEALREVARWRAAGVVVPVSVNLSPSDLQPELVADVARALAEAGVPGSALVLEITETGIVSDPVGAAAVLTALNDLGVEISIDDYGTGYSSLSLLMALPVTELKIDRVFVRDLASDARSAVVVRTTVDLAHSLGLRVVAEGVETPEVLAVLGELGCDVSQGYLHSRPLPAAGIREWLLGGSVQRPVAHASQTGAATGA